ncbi:MAG: hypothetical protein RL431_1020 [Actinomycetota bacterium]
MKSLNRRMMRATSLAGLIVVGAWFAATVVAPDISTVTVLATALGPWIVAAAVLVMVLALVSRAVIYAGIAVIIALLSANHFHVYPNFSAKTDPAATSGAAITVLSLNAYVGSAETDSLMAAIEQTDPDVVVLSEMNAMIRERYVQAGLAELYPYSYVVDDETWLSGQDIWSKTPLTNTRRVPTETFPVLAAETVIEGRTIDIVGVHMYSPLARRDLWAADHAALQRFVQAHATNSEAALVLAGDFNASRGLPPFDWVRDTGLTDAAEQTSWFFQRTSWPNDPLPLPVLSLDHVLVGEGVQVAGTEFVSIAGTDHRGIAAHLLVAGP